MSTAKAAKRTTLTAQKLKRKGTSYIRPNEHKALLGREYLVVQGLKKYIRNYKIAKTKLDTVKKTFGAILHLTVF